MPVLVGAGDRLILPNGSLSLLKRSSVPMSFYAGGSTINLSGGQTASYLNIYQTQHWVFTAVNKLNRLVAHLPLNVYRMVGDGDAGERERVRDHPLVDCLRRPVARRGPMYVKQSLMWPALLHGNALMEKVTPETAGNPTGLTALDWRFLRPVYTDEAQTEVAAWFSTQSGAERLLAADEVIHMAWAAGTGDIGLSPLSALASTLSTENNAQRYQESTFGNGVKYSSAYILPPDVVMTKEDKDELRAAIKAQAEGVDKAGGMALVSGGGDIKTLSHSAVEAELIDQRRLNREEIAAAYDIPPPLIGILDRATFSNIDTQHKMTYGMVLGPWMALMKETIQFQLIDPVDAWREERLFVDFDLSDVLKGEPLAEVQAIAAAIGTGIMTPNEGRERRNLPPSADPEAEKLHMPVNNLAPMGGSEDGGMAPLDLAMALQKIYLAVGTVITPDEAREILDRAGADLGPAPDDLAAGQKALLHHLGRASERKRRGNAMDPDRFLREAIKDGVRADLAHAGAEYLRDLA